MAARKCYQCGKVVSDDDLQIVNDQMVVAVAPLAELLGITAQKFVEGLFEEGQAYCARCFRVLDDETPLAQWAKDLADDPGQHPAMFQWHLIKKGPDHVG